MATKKRNQTATKSLPKQGFIHVGWQTYTILPPSPLPLKNKTKYYHPAGSVDHDGWRVERLGHANSASVPGFSQLFTSLFANLVIIWWSQSGNANSPFFGLIPPYCNVYCHSACHICRSRNKNKNTFLWLQRPYLVCIVGRQTGGGWVWPPPCRVG